MQSQIHSTPELKLKQNKEQKGKKQIAMHENLFKLNYLWMQHKIFHETLPVKS